MKLLITFGIVLPSLCFAQRDWSTVEVKSFEVTENISYLTGSGGNIGVIYGDDGMMIIDDQYAPLSEKIKATISTLSEGPIKFVINTHYHGDHTGGNENFQNDGATVVGHENVRKRLGTTFFNSVFQREVAAKTEGFWPTITFSRDMTFHFNGEEIKLIHVGSAHTDGDALVYFKTSNTLHAGDAFVRYGYPFIDVAAGGTIDGIIDAQKTILSLCDENTKIIPGHGDLATVKEVKELMGMLEATRRIVADAKNAGEKMEDLIARKPLEAFHDRWNGNFISSDLFVQLIFETI